MAFQTASYNSATEQVSSARGAGLPGRSRLNLNHNTHYRRVLYELELESRPDRLIRLSTKQN